MEITLRLEIAGIFTEQELNEFIIYKFGCGICSHDNSFINEDGDAEIVGVDVY